MKTLSALPAIALLLHPGVQAADRPAWAPLVLPEAAQGEVAPDLRACFEAHRAHLANKPNDLAPLVKDYPRAATR